jgi:hypothetical protein
MGAGGPINISLSLWLMDRGSNRIFGSGVHFFERSLHAFHVTTMIRDSTVSGFCKIIKGGARDEAESARDFRRG